MRTITLACALTFVIATEVLAAPLDKPREATPPLARDTLIGSGPYPAIIAEDPRLPKHTIYRPGNLEALGSRTLPVVAWGNGGCFDNGTAYRWFLSEVASYGFLVIANGSVGADPLHHVPCRDPGRLHGWPTYHLPQHTPRSCCRPLTGRRRRTSATAAPCGATSPPAGSR